MPSHSHAERGNEVNLPSITLTQGVMPAHSHAERGNERHEGGAARRPRLSVGSAHPTRLFKPFFGKGTYNFSTNNVEPVTYFILPVVPVVLVNVIETDSNAFIVPTQVIDHGAS